MVSLGKNINLDEARAILEANLSNGCAYEKFLELVSLQGGDINSVKISDNIISVKSNKSGYIERIDALALGEAARTLGAGRLKKEDTIDFEVGIYLNKKVGDYVEKDEELLKLYVHDKMCDIDKLISCFEINDNKCEKNNLIYEVIL